MHWAHQVSARFPDGQLYVNLRGYDPDKPLTAAEALAQFLTGLGLSGQDIPADLDDRAARYRTEVSGRRILIVLDNASSVEQVRPLLPGSRSAMVVVTSRDSLAGLVALHGAHRLDLDLLPLPDSISLLRRLIGPRVLAEPAAATALAAQCARLPLALRVAAELAVSRPTTSLADLSTELEDQQRRLDLLDAGGDFRAAVSAVFSWSYQHLHPSAARLFRLAGLHPGPDFDVYAAAALADISLDSARHTLDRLSRAHLIAPAGAGRYGMHDLLRAYATQLADPEQATAESAEGAAGAGPAALARLFDYYLAAAARAMDTFHPAERHRRPRIPAATTPMPVLTELDAARTWLDTERPTLGVLASYTADHGWPNVTVLIATTLFRYLAGGHFADALVIHDHARRAAQQTGDVAGEACALNGLGVAHGQLSRSVLAADHFARAAGLFRQAGDRAGEARAVANLGAAEQRLGRYKQASGHFHQALGMYRESGDRDGEARALTNLGLLEYQLGHDRPAAGHLQQALDLHRETDNQEGEAHALANLGLAELELRSAGVATPRYWTTSAG